MIGLDSNVLVRYLVEDEPKQARRAVALIEARCLEDDPGFINRIVLCELVWVLESCYAYPRERIAATIENLLRTRELQIDAGQAAWVALRRYRGGAVDFADAFIGQLNRAVGCEATATFDRGAARLDDFFPV